MLPFPSAVNDPMRAKKPVCTFVPLMKKAYWPFRLALEELPAGGGGAGVEPLPLQAAANSAKPNARSKAIRFIVFVVRMGVGKFTAHLPADSLRHSWRPLSHALLPESGAIHDSIGPRPPVNQPAPDGQGKRCSDLPSATGRQTGRSCLEPDSVSPDGATARPRDARPRFRPMFAAARECREAAFWNFPCNSEPFPA